MSLTGIRQYPAISVNVGVTQCPLTFQQERVLYFCELDPNSSIWDINTCKRLNGNINVNVLKKAVELLIDSHQILRTRIFRGADGPVQSFDQDTSESLSTYRHVARGAMNLMARLQSAYGVAPTIAQVTSAHTISEVSHHLSEVIRGGHCQMLPPLQRNRGCHEQNRSDT